MSIVKPRRHDFDCAERSSVYVPPHGLRFSGVLSSEIYRRGGRYHRQLERLKYAKDCCVRRGGPSHLGRGYESDPKLAPPFHVVNVIAAVEGLRIFAGSGVC